MVTNLRISNSLKLDNTRRTQCLSWIISNWTPVSLIKTYQVWCQIDVTPTFMMAWHQVDLVFSKELLPMETSHLIFSQENIIKPSNLNNSWIISNTSSYWTNSTNNKWWSSAWCRTRPTKTITQIKANLRKRENQIQRLHWTLSLLSARIQHSWTEGRAAITSSTNSYLQL